MWKACVELFHMFGVAVSTLCWCDTDPSQEIHSHAFVFKEMANPCIFHENSLICWIFFFWVPLGKGIEFSRKSKFESLCKTYLRAFCFQTITFPRNIKKKYISFFLVYFFAIFRSTPVIFISALWPSSSLTCWKLNIHWSTSLNQGLELPNDKYMHTPPASHMIFFHLFMSFFPPMQKTMPRCILHRPTAHWDFPCSQTPDREHFCFHLLL